MEDDTGRLQVALGVELLGERVKLALELSDLGQVLNGHWVSLNLLEKVSVFLSQLVDEHLHGA